MLITGKFCNNRARFSRDFTTFATAIRKVGRVTECAGLEIRYTPFGYRGFESLTFRHRKACKALSRARFFYPRTSSEWHLGSPDEYWELFSPLPKKASYPCKTGRQVWDDAKPCTSAQLQRDLKIRNILDTTKNSSTSCVLIIRLLKQSGEPGCRSTGVVHCHYFQNLCNPLYINRLPT